MEKLAEKKVTNGLKFSRCLEWVAFPTCEKFKSLGCAFQSGSNILIILGWND